MKFLTEMKKSAGSTTLCTLNSIIKFHKTVIKLINLKHSLINFNDNTTSNNTGKGKTATVKTTAPYFGKEYIRMSN